MAAKTVEFQRLQAASYLGKSQEVISNWQKVCEQQQHLCALEVGRAYLDAGMLPEAEQQFQSVLKVQREWGTPTFVESHNFLSYTLAQFYIGEILEQRGKRGEATSAYKDFLSHFQNSSARLPQIVKARAALRRLMEP